VSPKRSAIVVGGEDATGAVTAFGGLAPASIAPTIGDPRIATVHSVRHGVFAMAGVPGFMSELDGSIPFESKSRETNRLPALLSFGS